MANSLKRMTSLGRAAPAGDFLLAHDVHLVESFPTVGELEVLVIDLQPERLGFLVGGGLIDGQTVCPLLVVSRDNALAVDLQEIFSRDQAIDDHAVTGGLERRVDVSGKGGGRLAAAFFVDLKANLFSFGPNLPTLTPRASAWPVLALRLIHQEGVGGVRESASKLEVAQYPYSFKRIPFSVIWAVSVFHQIDRGVVKIYEGNAFVSGKRPALIRRNFSNSGCLT